MKPLPWSYSSLSSFAQCPRNYYEIKVAKRYKDAPNEKALWGTYCHEEFEKALRNGTPLPENLKQYEGYMKGLREYVPGEKHFELKGGLTRKLEPCSFFDNDVWVRVILDYVAIDWSHKWAVVVDHKSGNSRYHDPKQLMLFALWVFYKWPEVQGVETRYHWFTEGSNTTKEVYMRHHMDDLWSLLMPDLKQYAQAFKDEVWQERESWKCGFCPVTECKHWREPRTK